jgi:hypothetical protein
MTPHTPQKPTFQEVQNNLLKKAKEQHINLIIK